MPVIAVNILYYAVGRWNGWFDALLYIKTRSLLPLQMFLREILVQSELNNMGVVSQSLAQNVKYASIIITILPILIVYPFVQKYFVKGVMVGSLKG
jgi:putative aldouronate transport system permease protein